VSTKDGHEYERVEYTPYGELWIEQRSEHMDQDGKTPFRFTGKELDAETGFYYYGARYLNPKTSIWISADPAVGDYIPKAPVDDEAKKHNENLPGMGGVFNYVNFHVYHYAGNNPIRYIDPDGREGKINLLKEFFDIFSIDIKIGIGLDLSIVSDLNFDLYSLQGTLSTDGLTDTITRGIGMWIIGVEQTAPKIEGMADMDSFSRFGKLEGNIGFFRFGEDGSDFVFSFGGQALVGFKFNISGNEIIDFIIKMGDTTHNE
jgi:RHS repeat-associated protein